MKKSAILALFLVFALILAGCSNYIGGEKAIDIALKDLGITRVGAARTDAVLNKGSDPVTYDVKINLNDHFVNFVINAKTGEIISSESKK